MYIISAIATLIWFTIEMGFATLAVAIPCKIFGWTFSWIPVIMVYLAIETYFDIQEMLVKQAIISQLKGDIEDDEEDED